MCWDTNCQTHDCDCSHWNHKCTCHLHDDNIYNWYHDWDIVWETDFQIVDKDEFENMKGNWEIWGNLWDDLVNMWFIDKNSPLYDEMKNEWREWMFYDE